MAYRHSRDPKQTKTSARNIIQKGEIKMATAATTLMVELTEDRHNPAARETKKDSVDGTIHMTRISRNLSSKTPENMDLTTASVPENQ